MSELVFEKRAADSKYLHKDFHASLNNAIDYVGKVFGEEAVKEYIRRYTASRYHSMSLEELKRYFSELYAAEEAGDLLYLESEEDYLKVSVSSSPGLRYLTENNERVSEWYYLGDTYLYECLAEVCGLDYELLSYEKETGCIEFVMRRRGEQ